MRIKGCFNTHITKESLHSHTLQRKSCSKKLMHQNGMDDNIFCGEVDETLFVLFEDEVENSHIFGDQSINALLDVCSVQNCKQAVRTSFRFRKPSKVSAWHGSCASFRGNNSELLNLSSSWNESNASCMYLELCKHDEALKNTTSTTAFDDKQGNGTLESEMCKVTPEEKYDLKTDPRQRRFEGKYSDSVVTALNESRFNSSLLMPECSDQLPRKPKRDEVVINVYIDDDDDGTDAEFTDIITVNPYESICTTLKETMTVVERLFETTTPTPDDTSVAVVGSQYLPDNDLQRISTVVESFDRNTVSSDDGNSIAYQHTKGHAVQKEDEAPKRPTRGMSPPRVCRPSYSDSESYECGH